MQRDIIQCTKWEFTTLSRLPIGSWGGDTAFSLLSSPLDPKVCTDLVHRIILTWRPPMTAGCSKNRSSAEVEDHGDQFVLTVPLRRCKILVQVFMFLCSGKTALVLCTHATHVSFVFHCSAWQCVCQL